MLVTVDDHSPIPPSEQLRSQLALMIAGGALASETRLPSVRQLAADLKLAPGTVARVYKDLEASGHVVTHKTGTRVATLGPRADQERRRHLDDAAQQFAQRSTRAGFKLSEALDAVRRAYRDRTQPTSS